MSSRSSVSGMTLIEVLVVIVIISALGALAVPRVVRMLGRGEAKAVQAKILQVAAQLESYQHHPRNGDYPPTTLEGYPGVGSLKNFDNCGSESVVLCLSRKGRSGGMDFESSEKKLLHIDNMDGDQTAVPLTNFGDQNKELYELVDPWGTPLVYFHHRDYELIEKRGWGTVSLGGGDVIDAKPWRDAKTQSFAAPHTFQLISAGPDGEFNTDDDLTNFSR